MSVKVLIRTTCVLFLFLFIFSTNCFAVVWYSNELIEKARELNGRKLNYSGELVTAVMDRGEYSWINLNDGFNAIGVWCKSSMLKEVRYAGDFKNHGDIIEVKGAFNRACSMHNGELDIHAETVKIIKRGHSFEKAIKVKSIESSAALFALLLVTIVIFRKRL